ncbi:DUF2378 family protein [Aggregicoccus sp. 17bor-14]|uniref:DUF2378 family protein n=1 Tax=Myxococcaceae TaxID=31 RepID=UPI00129CAA3B|nr:MULTISPECIES: DUF2378 family protein [Myxococcaceae]MBF5044013.1 DUF2378 family protein [Simulacricoccus sp. 17bor-14]MRI89764.1 DUF2378 family protein [Aggregicoccus sp. 17bor-14]
MSTPLERPVRVSALEAILRGLGHAPGSPAWREAAGLLGGQLGALPAIVPVESYVELMRWAARTAFPTLIPTQGIYEVGLRLVDGYQQTLVGKLQLATLPLLGPHRIAMMSPDLFRRNAPFGTRTIRQVGPGQYLLEFRGIPIPSEFYVGALTSSLRVAGMKGGDVTARVLGPEDVDYDIRWRED